MKFYEMLLEEKKQKQRRICETRGCEKFAESKGKKGFRRFCYECRNLDRAKRGKKIWVKV